MLVLLELLKEIVNSSRQKKNPTKNQNQTPSNYIETAKNAYS